MLADKTLFITGASAASGWRLRCAPRATAPTSLSPQRPRSRIRNSSGTIYTAAEEIERAGGKALPLVVDVRDEATVKAALEQTAAKVRRRRHCRQQC